MDLCGEEEGQRRGGSVNAQRGWHTSGKDALMKSGTRVVSR